MSDLRVQDTRAQLAIGWTIAALQRTKRMPTLKKLLRPRVSEAEALAATAKARAEHDALMREVT